MQEGDYRCEEQPLELLWVNSYVAAVGCVVPIGGHGSLQDQDVNRIVICAKSRIPLEGLLRGVKSSGLNKSLELSPHPAVAGNPTMWNIRIFNLMMLTVSSEDTIRGGNRGTGPLRSRLRRLTPAI